MFLGFLKLEFQTIRNFGFLMKGSLVKDEEGDFLWKNDL
ncbi:hypothetical protein MBCUT_08650 [Methanobrevibacter cuticularis]|uniref:Uncharacterized protein n=1 Tax=Methanobrevibacter cuticularis TaxID=47311 RepID=A0A166E807_9EURY|nr:hypothetical protein MBCUT_08650 [Methanobrevibacter cuticularis]